MLNPQLAFDSSLLNLSDILPGQPLRREVFEEVRAIGFGGIELHPYAKPFATRWYGKDAREIAELAREAGLGISAYHLGEAPRLKQPTPREFADSLVADFDAAREIGAQFVIAHGPPIDQRLATELGERAVVSRIAPCWKQAAMAASDRGLALVWSYREFSATDACYLGFDEILRKVDEPNFGIEFDLATEAIDAATDLDERVSEGLPTAGVLSQIERYKGLIASVRLSDATVDKGSQDYEVEPRLGPGEGKFDWSRVVPALLDAWIPSPWWVVEPGNRAGAEECVAFFERNVIPRLPETTSSARPGTAS